MRALWKSKRRFTDAIIMGMPSSREKYLLFMFPEIRYRSII
jgi:hypothetical protein